ncbi:MAG: hypothetical protein HYZ37_15010 [Candidatus Solibacter usitatus]|nr:hypothetical protein [Candidatus Solibacter usitatus]
MSTTPVTITLTDGMRRMLPASVRRKAGFKLGDELEVKADHGIVTLINKPPAAVADEYTPEQWQIVRAQIEEGLEDVRKGRVSRPFDTVEKMLASMKATSKSSRRKKIRSR